MGGKKINNVRSQEQETFDLVSSRCASLIFADLSQQVYIKHKVKVNQI